MYRLKLEQFEGPLDLLLQLIERQELNITDVSLAAVTEQYLGYLDRQTDLPVEELADFLVVAAKLLLLKSRALLPDLFIDDEDDIGSGLVEQLAIYKQYVEAGHQLARRLRKRRFSYARERLPMFDAPVEFSPPANLTTYALKSSFAKILDELKEFVRPMPELISRTISLQEKISALRKLFEGGGKVSFKKILDDAKSRMEIIVSFLAILELIKQRHVVASQDGHGAHIVLMRLGEETI